MARFNPNVARACNYKKIPASSTAAQVSVPGDGIRGNDYLERVVVIAASTAAPGIVTVFDGTTSLVVHNVQITGYTLSNIVVYEVGVLCDSTVGFNISCGTSVSALAIGRFSAS
jgi:hypothetical protein